MQICETDNCVGCFACVNVCPNHCISMESDREGFKYPFINESLCMHCNKCRKVCSGLGYSKTHTRGNVPDTYGAKNKDDAIRLRSSSGGIFYLFAKKIFDLGGVVVGASFDREYKVVHTIISDVNDIGKIMGSKYLQSECGTIYHSVRKYLQNGKIVLFTGTPCQIAALKKYLDKEYDSLICLDIVCHGVPSPKVWERYLDFLSLNSEKIKSVSFRDKDTGWKNYNIKITGEIGNVVSEINHTNVYMRGFVNDLYLRKSCYDCQYKGEASMADVTLGDFWGIHKLDKEFDDDKGVSLIMIRTYKGEEVFHSIKDEIILKRFSYDDAAVYNPSVRYSSGHMNRRDKFFAFWEHEDFDKLVDRIIGEE